MRDKKLIAGNWKMNMSASKSVPHFQSIHEHCSNLRKSEVLVFPQSPVIPLLLNEKKNHTNSSPMVGCQNISQFDEGAFTGEIYAGLIKELGCSHVLVGHSERRAIYGETDQICAEKFSKATSLGLSVVYCIGESLEEREGGDYLAVLERQVRAIPLQSRDNDKYLTIAYEPVWSIGTGKTASPEQADEVHTFLRKLLTSISPSLAETRILYGGSANVKNAANLLAIADIDGLLIGGASLKPEFLDIINISEQ